VGFGAALGGVNWLAVLAFSLVTGIIAIIAGRHVGEAAAGKFRFNLSWLGGVALIALALGRLV
jgi:putative Mn2+ efflux pump MntP